MYSFTKHVKGIEPLPLGWKPSILTLIRYVQTESMGLEPISHKDQQFSKLPDYQLSQLSKIIKSNVTTSTV